MAKIFVKPAPGLLIRYPENLMQILPAAGDYVEDHREWQRKINFGDVVLVSSVENEPKKSKGKNTNDTQPEGDNK